MRSEGAQTNGRCQLRANKYASPDQHKKRFVVQSDETGSVLGHDDRFASKELFNQ